MLIENSETIHRVLNSLDRLLSSYSGRQCVLQVDDHDVDLPIECDDDYWDHVNPSLAFKQPPHKPSEVAYFNSYIKLMDILAYAMRAIYSVKKPLNGQNVAYLDQKIVMDLDSALNNWMDSVPDHQTNRRQRSLPWPYVQMLLVRVVTSWRFKAERRCHFLHYM
ncbi:hypothetical protein H0H87_000980 [Tephrocybe sp. NHM501043]|nr:hypothetical protein H0H87_000980 [Tephrocybe sp. NHM501043]